MKRMIALYAVALAGGAFLLQWLQYKYFVRAFSTEIYIGLIAAAFTGLGVWAGLRLARRPASAYRGGASRSATTRRCANTATVRPASGSRSPASTR